MPDYKVSSKELGSWTIKPVTYSGWNCYMFGGDDECGIVYRPQEGKEPNRFARWMMKVCFACTWKKVV